MVIRPKILGFNFRMSDVSCALGISQIQRIKKFIRKGTI